MGSAVQAQRLSTCGRKDGPSIVSRASGEAEFMGADAVGWGEADAGDRGSSFLSASVFPVR